MSWLTESSRKTNWLTRSLSINWTESNILSTSGGISLSKLACMLSKSVFLSKGLAAVACLVLLTGCATEGSEVRIVRVEVPVLVPCKTQEVTAPSWASAGLKKADSLEMKVRALLAERRQRMGYERELAAAVGTCL